MSRDLCRCGSINLLVYVLVILFGISSWVDINGLWVELPILVQNLPEGWDLPSYMSVIIQVANIAPLIYTIVSTIWPHRMFEVPVIYIIISLGGVACLLLAFLWGVTSHIAGAEHSTALFVLQFCLALVDCTSSVAFLPFMSVFKPQYMTAYFIGEGFSGLIPSLLALGQGAGSMTCVKTVNFHNYSTKNDIETSKNITSFGIYDNVFTSTLTFPESVTTQPNNTSVSSISIFPMYQAPRFSVKVFFLLLMLLMIVSILSFTLLNFWSYCKREQTVVPSDLSKNSRFIYEDHDASTTLTSDVDTKIIHFNETAVVGKNTCKCFDICNHNRQCCKRGTVGDTANSKSLFQFTCPDVDNSSEESDGIPPNCKPRRMSAKKYSLFLLLTAYLNAISNGLLPSIQTFSCLPYGIEQYHLSVTLASIANPVACLASFVLKMKSATWTLLMTFIGTGLTGYIMWTASTSPTPPLVDHSAGPVILILCWVLVVFVITYTKVSIATEFREEGKKALLWIGASSQAGSLLGALVIFFVVSVFKLFQAGNPCV